MKVDRHYLLEESKVFCMAPWVNYLMHQNGQIAPCCFADISLGHASDGFEAVWQGKAIREMRRQMLADKPNPQCQVCYANEEAGIPSMRRWLNEANAAAFDAVLTTNEDGTAPDAKPREWDFRFNNTCDQKCRICEQFYSTAWQTDAKALGFGEIGFLRAVDNIEGFLQGLEPVADNARVVRFLGGEPLLADEVRATIEFLARNTNKQMKLFFLTNLNRITATGRRIIELMNEFEQVVVHVSLDESGERGELIRSGQNWPRVLDNIEYLKRNVPHVNFCVETTVSLFNVMNLHNFHKELIEAAIIERPHHISLHLLHLPKHWSVQLLSAEMKTTLERELHAHARWLESTSRM